MMCEELLLGLLREAGGLCEASASVTSRRMVGSGVPVLNLGDHALAGGLLDLRQRAHQLAAVVGVGDVVA